MIIETERLELLPLTPLQLGLCWLFLSGFWSDAALKNGSGRNDLVAIIDLIAVKYNDHQ